MHRRHTISPLLPSKKRIGHERPDDCFFPPRFTTDVREEVKRPQQARQTDTWLTRQACFRVAPNFPNESFSSMSNREGIEWV
jgi:hypothetical protein